MALAFSFPTARFDSVNESSDWCSQAYAISVSVGLKHSFPEIPLESMSTIPELVARLNDALDAIDWMGRKSHPSLRPPASEENIAAYEQKIGWSLPKTYREFLLLHDGMHGLEQYDWGIRGVTPIRKGDNFEDVQSGHLYVYKDKDSNHPAAKDLQAAAVVVGSDFDYQIVYFTPETIAEEEPSLRRLAMDQPYEHYNLFSSFKEFLAFVVESYEDLVALQEESMEGFDDLDALAEQEQLLKELASLLSEAPEGGDGGDDELAPEPEPQLSPEMERASRLCRIMMQKLIDADLLELVEGPGMFEALEDLMLKQLMRSNSPQDAVERWIRWFAKAREVEEIYGTDEQLEELMYEAFDEIAEES